MVTLRAMSKPRHDRWAAAIWPVYYEELIQAGFSEEVAKRDASPNPENSIEYGKVSPGNHILEVVLEGKDIGNVWLVDQGVEWWIYDIEIDEAHRGKGLGRLAMRAIESYVKEHGGTTVWLSVFGFNQTAQTLYLSEGFESARLQMKKRL
ncbi:MAG: hypothetical protein RIS26_11 [Actinomycetota bacterium]|jgi:ribosomal protein S18 acetylase RimI-like enzyme